MNRLLAGCVLCVTGAVSHGAPFGRFGRVHEDGLLTLNVSPRSVEVPVTSGRLRISWPSSNKPPKVLAINSDHKVLALEPVPGGPTRVEFPLGFPGIVMQFGKSGKLLLGKHPWQLEKREDIGAAAGYCSYVLRGRSEAAEPTSAPMMIQVRKSVRIVPEGATLNLVSPGLIGPVRILTPNGIAPEGQDESLVGAGLLGELGVPHMVSKTVKRAGDEWCVTERWSSQGGRPISPISPVLWFAIQRGYPARIDGRVLDSKVMTKWGSFAFVDGNVLTYRLPAVPSGERRYFGQSRSSADNALLESLVDDLQMKWAKNAVDLGYSRAAPVLMMGDLAPRAMHAAALKALRPEAAFAMPPYRAKAEIRPWQMETEPLTRKKYLWTYFISGEGPYKYDIEWGNALPVYGLWQKHKDDPAVLRRHWPAVKRVMEYLDLAHDWAWMTVCNADHGYSTGTGDPMVAAYAACVAAEKIARRIGDAQGEKKFGFMAAEIGVAACARLTYTQFARDEGLIGPQSVVLGYHEREGFTRVKMGTSDPWGPVTLLSGSGCQPELIELYIKFARKPLQRFVSDFETAYPSWYDGTFVYPFETTYQGNAGYVTFPVWYAEMALGRNTSWLKQRLDSMVTNRLHAWVGCNALAEFWSTDHPAILTDCKRVGLTKMTLESDSTATINALPDSSYARKRKRLVRIPTRWSIGGTLRAGWRLSAVFGASMVVKGSQFIISGENAQKGPIQIRLAFART